MTRRLIPFVMAAVMVVFSVSLAAAEEVKLDIKAASTIRDVLNDHVGKKVALRLEAGEEIEGVVVMVGNSVVHMTRLTGKEYFDSVVRIDTIAAVRIRVKER